MGAIALRKSGLLSREEYLNFLETRSDKERWQLIDGAAVMMNPPTLAHQRIAGNLVRRLNNALEIARPDLVALNEVGLTVEPHPEFLPEVDVVVIDDMVDYSSYAARFYLTAEIRSESNTEEYMSLKIQRYTEHPFNLYAVLIAQRQRRIALRSRANGWTEVTLRSPDDVLELPEFGFQCTLRDLYRGTPLA